MTCRPERPIEQADEASLEELMGDVENAEAEATLGSRSHVKELLRLPRTRRGMEAMEGVSRCNRPDSGGWNLYNLILKILFLGSY